MIHRAARSIVLGSLWAWGLIACMPVMAADAVIILGTGDTLRVSVRELTGPGQEYVTDVMVNEHGEIPLRNLGRVHVAGLTPVAAEEKIAQVAVARRFLMPPGNARPGPQVSVKCLSRGGADAVALCTIGAGDMLEVKAFELVTPGVEYVTQARVDELGDIRIMYLGTLHVTGFSPTRLEDRIAQAAVEGKFLLPASATNIGPQVFVRMLRKAPPGSVVAGTLPGIGPVDTLRIQIFELTAPGQEYAAETQVDEQGNITLRVLGAMPVAGLTTRQLEQKIAEKAVSAGALMPKGPTHPGPQVIVTLLQKATPGERPATIRAGESLRVEVVAFGALDFPRETTLRVDGAGDIDLEKVGRIHVAGLTPAQAERAIAARAVAGGIWPAQASGPSGPQVYVSWIKPTAAADPGPGGLP